MNIYVNGFRCSSKNDGSEFIISFIQSGPKYDEDGKVNGVNNEIVSSFVMRAESAKQLADLIMEVYPNKDDVER